MKIIEPKTDKVEEEKAWVKIPKELTEMDLTMLQ